MKIMKRSSISLYGKKMAVQNKSKEATINLVTPLNGIVWRQVEHSADKLAEDTDGFTKVLEILDVVFKYDDRVEAPRALEFFLCCWTSTTADAPELRRAADHREKKREVERRGIKAGLTPDQAI